MKRGTPDHPKTAALAAALGINRAHACGILELLWHFTAKFAPQGDIGKWSDESIAEGVHWCAEGVRLVQSLADTGWLDRCTERRYIVHDWADHIDDSTAKSLKRKGLDVLQPVRTLSRQRRTKSDNVQKCPDKNRLPEPVPEPVPSQSQSLVCPEPDKPASEPPVLLLPCVGTGPKEYPLTQAKLAEYAESFPGVDVLAAIKAARQWLIDNPTRRKTFDGIGRFLTTWLNKEQNRGSPAAANGAATSRRSEALNFELDP